jgi:DNA-binding beta-propeller fold protein YncE
VSTLAGTGKEGRRDGEATVARFDFPTGIAVDGDGNVIVADMFNHRICKITPQVFTLPERSQTFPESSITFPERSPTFSECCLKLLSLWPTSSTIVSARSRRRFYRTSTRTSCSMNVSKRSLNVPLLSLNLS